MDYVALYFSHICDRQLNFILFYSSIHLKTFTIVPFPIQIAHTSYQILCPKLLVGVADPKKCAAHILGETGLADDTFRLGNTKARSIFLYFIHLSNGKFTLPLQNIFDF